MGFGGGFAVVGWLRDDVVEDFVDDGGGLDEWVASVERRSSRAVADAGMELMEVPPEMWPTLMVVCGSAGSCMSAIG